MKYEESFALLQLVVVKHVSNHGFRFAGFLLLNLFVSETHVLFNSGSRHFPY